MNLTQSNYNNLEDVYLVGISGGPDSVYLLHYLLNKGYKKLILVHINYNKRPTSNRDEEIVNQLANKFFLPFETLNVTEELQGNFQNWARKIRLSFFKKNINKYKAKGVFLGHNLNDQVETFLIKKHQRKTLNFSGIKNIQLVNDIYLFRPILEISRQQIIEFLDSNKINYGIDETNDSEIYLRNSIRKNIKNYEHHAILQKIKENKIKEEQIVNLIKKNSSNLFYITNFLSLNKEEKFFFFKIWTNYSLSLKNIENITCFLAKKTNPNGIFELKQIKITKQYDQFFLQELEQKNISKYEVIIENKNFSFQNEYLSISSSFKIDHKCWEFCGNFPLKIRNYESLDKINEKKISKLFIKNKIPLNYRKKWPVIVDLNEQIISVIGIKNINSNECLKKLSIYYKII
ncbi:MAG: tRNA lysidine(34) synthetase TilS [Mycoplasma sp.]